MAFVVLPACKMSMARQVAQEYSALLARAFNGAINVDGQRIVAHPSGTLIVRGSEPRIPTPQMTRPLDRDNDWSDV
jgi:hypothetical protein